MSKSKISTCLIVVGFAVGCVEKADFAAERAKRSAAFMNEVPKYSLDTTRRVFSLKDCVDISLTNSLEVQIKQLSEQITKEQKEGNLYAMLPSMSLSARNSARSNDSGGTSMGIDDKKQSLRPSTSSDRDTWTTRGELAWSTLDFGLAYMKHMKLDDQMEQGRIDTEKAAQDLRFRVTQAYFSAAAALSFMQNTSKHMKRCEEALVRLEKGADQADPSEIIRLKKEFKGMRLQLREYERSFKNHSLNLSSLMGVVPVDDMKVDTTPFERFRTEAKLPFKLPAYNELLKTALLNRDELRTNDVNRHLTEIAKNEKFISLFPNVKLFAAHNWDSNSFLYNQSWTEIGASAMMDVMKIPALQKELKANGLEGIALQYKEAALSMAVMAQLSIALNNMEEVKERTQYQSDLYDLSVKDRDLMVGKAKQGVANDLLLAEKELQLAMSEMDRTTAIGNLYVAYYRVLTTCACVEMPLPTDGSVAMYDRDSRNRIFHNDAPGLNRGLKAGLGQYLPPLPEQEPTATTGLRPTRESRSGIIQATDKPYEY